jgi:hypothetical protein
MQFLSAHMCCQTLGALFFHNNSIDQEKRKKKQANSN